jgi:AsmA protein
MRKKIFIILLCCAIAVAMAVGGAMWWTARYLRTPEFRAELASLVLDATGHNATLSGELSVSFFPWFGLRAGEVRLDNEAGFGPEPLLAAKEISAHIKVLPIFDKRLVFDTLELGQASLNLALDKEGRGNWEGLVAHLREQENATDKADAYFRKITVRGVRLAESAIRIDDSRHNHSYIMTAVDLRTGRIEAGKPLPFTVTTDFTWPRPGLTAHLEGTGKLHWSKNDHEPLLTDTKVQGEVGGTFMPKSSPSAGITTELSVVDGKHLKLSDVRLRLLGSDVTGEITFVDVTERFKLDAKLNLGRFSPRAVINAYWPGTIAHDHKGALASAEGRLDIHADVDQLVFETPGFSVDESRLKGKVRMGFDEISGLDFDLDADKLDADALHAAFNSNATGSPLVVEDLPMNYLREVKGEGRIGAGQLKLAGVAAQNAVLSWQAGGGAHKLVLKPVKAQGGTIGADFATSFAVGRGGQNAQAKDSDKGKAKTPPPGKPDPKAAAPDAKPGQTVLGWTGNLVMDDVDAKKVSWLNGTGFTISGKMDLRLHAEVKPTHFPAKTRLAVVLRRATGDAQASLGASQLDWASDAGKARSAARRMHFSSIQAQTHFTQTSAGDADWAVQLDGGFSAVGTTPVMNLETKVSGQLISRQGRTRLAGASVSGRLKGWFLPKAEPEAVFSARGGLDISSQSLSIAQSSVQAFGLSMTAALAGTKVLDPGWSLGGRVRCQDGDPRRALGALGFRPPKGADKRSLQRVSGEADLSTSARGLTLSRITGQFDTVPFAGSYSLQDFSAPRHSLALSGGNFDLDRYLPAPPPPKRGSAPERPTPEPLPVDALRELNLDANVALRSFKLRGLTTRDFKASASAHGGSLAVKPLGGNFYGGTLSGEFSAQAQQNGMQTRLALVAKDFQAGGFMLGWAGKEVVTGKADLFLDVTGEGATDQDVLRSLGGLGSFKVVDGSYAFGSSGDAPARTPSPALAGRHAGGAAPAAMSAPPRNGTPFSLAQAHFKVHGGVFRTEDFRLDSPGRVVRGKGGFCPAEESIDVGLTASMTGMPDVPIRVHGRLRDPEMDISTGALIGNTIKELLGLPLKPVKFFKDLLF